MNRSIVLPVALRASLIALLVYGVARPDLPQFHGKGIVLRLVFYPLLTCVVPVVWLALKRPGTYPYAIDSALVMPFISDSGGNVLNLYDRVWWWDKLEHGVNWATLVGGVALLLTRTRVRAPELAGLAIGFGAAAGIVWELAEYVGFIRTNQRELRIAYTNTLGDLLWDLVGSIAAGSLVAWISARRRV